MKGGRKCGKKGRKEHRHLEYLPEGTFHQEGDEMMLVVVVSAEWQNYHYHHYNCTPGKARRETYN